MEIIKEHFTPRQVKFSRTEIPYVCDFLRSKNIHLDVIHSFRVQYQGLCRMNSDGISGIEKYSFSQERVEFQNAYPLSRSSGATIFKLQEISEYLFQHGAYGCDAAHEEAEYERQTATHSDAS